MVATVVLPALAPLPSCTHTLTTLCRWMHRCFFIVHTFCADICFCVWMCVCRVQKPGSGRVGGGGGGAGGAGGRMFQQAVPRGMESGRRGGRGGGRLRSSGECSCQWVSCCCCWFLFYSATHTGCIPCSCTLLAPPATPKPELTLSTWTCAALVCCNKLHSTVLLLLLAVARTREDLDAEMDSMME